MHTHKLNKYILYLQFQHNVAIYRSFSKLLNEVFLRICAVKMLCLPGVHLHNLGWSKCVDLTCLFHPSRSNKGAVKACKSLVSSIYFLFFIAWHCPSFEGEFHWNYLSFKISDIFKIYCYFLNINNYIKIPLSDWNDLNHNYPWLSCSGKITNLNALEIGSDLCLYFSYFKYQRKDKESQGQMQM